MKNSEQQLDFSNLGLVKRDLSDNDRFDIRTGVSLGILTTVLC